MVAIDEFKTLTWKLDVADNLNFHDGLCGQIKPITSTIPLFARPMQKYELAISAAEGIYKRPQSAPQSGAILQLETERVNLFKLVSHTVNDKLKFSIDPVIKAAAATVMPKLKNYSEITKQNYAAKTEDIENLVNDLLTLTAELTTLGILNDVNSLRAKNEEFKNLYIVRQNYTYGVLEDGSSSQHKQAMNAAFSDVCLVVTAFQLTFTDDDDLEKLDNIARIINAAIHQYTLIWHHHQALLGKKDEATPLDPDQDATGDFLPEEGED